jgi:TPP-dependent pyruvate/acetoin dehydrogenase alpha subunit
MVASKQQHLTLPPVTSVQKPDSHASSVISGEKLKQLYKLMLRLRRANHKAGRRNSKHRFAEACEAATVIDLRLGDTVATLPGQHLDHAIESRAANDRTDNKPTPAAWNALELTGRDRLAIAAGIAFVHRRTASVVIAFAAANEIARAKDSVLFAQKQNLPIIYLEKAKNSVRVLKPTLHDLPTIPVDDSDVVAAYRVVFEATEKARRGVGPTLIQCIGHHKRSNGTLTNQHPDSMAYMELYLRKQNLWSEDLHI